MEEYRYFEYLRDQIAEIDIYGADDVFGSSGNKEIKASLARNGYDFWIFERNVLNYADIAPVLEECHRSPRKSGEGFPVYQKWALEARK